MKAIASWAIASTVLGVRPVVAPTPTLSNATTRRSAASASTSAGSQLSRLPRKCCNRTSGISPSPRSRYAYSMALSAVTRWIDASAYVIGVSGRVCSCAIAMRQYLLARASRAAVIAGRRDRALREKRPERLALVQGERGDVDEADDVWGVFSERSHDLAAVGVPDDDRRAVLELEHAANRDGGRHLRMPVQPPPLMTRPPLSRAVAGETSQARRA